MKKILFFTIALSTFGSFAFGQGHASIPYQAVARDVSGNLLVSQNISLRFTVHDVTSTGTILYQETQSQTTNTLGLFTALVGKGTVVSGTFSSIQWSSANSKFLQVEMDPTGGNTYTNMGTTQMFAAPYSFYADTAGNIPSGSITADDGLNINAGNNVELGGTLNKASTITQGNYTLTHNLTGTGDFVIQNNGTNSLNVLGHHGAATDGNIGVGNSSPASPLTVGTNSILTGSDLSTYTVSRELVTDSPTVTTGNEAGAAFVSTPYVTANSSATNYTIAADATSPVTTYNYTTLGAMNALSTFNSSGTLTTSYGINSTSENNGTGTITTAYGLSGIVKNNAAGSHITTAYGVRGRINSVGSITTAYALYGDVLNSGTLTTAYGLYTGPIAGTTHWSVYASDATSPSYFAGTVDFGSSTAGSYVGITTPTSGVTNYTITLPPTIGAAGSILANSATAGTLVWEPATAVAWGIGGNTFTVAAAAAQPNFLGTTASSTNAGQDIIFETGGTDAGLIDAGVYGNETFLGYEAGLANVSTATPGNNGNYNVGIGNYSMKANTTGAYNTALGYYSMLNVTTSSYNTAIGAEALQGETAGEDGTFNGGYNTVVGAWAAAQTTADSNVVVGAYALYNTSGSATTGGSNTAIGTAALLNCQTGWNVAVGLNALAADVTGQWNTAVGSNALTGTTAYGNTAVGYYAGKANAGGYNNTAFGDSALQKNTNTSGNTAIGAQALSASTTSFANTAVGSTAMYYSTGNYNIAVGDSALFGVSGGSSGGSNTAVGHAALAANTTNGNNTAVGYIALRLNTGASNTAVGSYALKNNGVGASNTAVGYSALTANTINFDNTAVGTNALQLSTSNGNTAIGMNNLFKLNTGFWNTAVGDSALYSSTSADSNSALGYQAGYLNATGSGNVFVGFQAGSVTGNNAGSDNVYVGALAGNPSGTANLSNYVAIGYGAGTTGATSNSIDLGNIYVATIRTAPTSISTYSDARIKDNVKENVPGLDFIKKLRPVTYNLNSERVYELTHNGETDKNNWDGKHDIDKITQSGFIAQEVEKAAQEVGYDFNGLHKPNGANDLYSLGYTDFVMPLVKGMQEQQSMIDSQKQVIEKLQQQLDQLNKRIATLESK